LTEKVRAGDRHLELAGRDAFVDLHEVLVELREVVGAVAVGDVGGRAGVGGVVLLIQEVDAAVRAR
jgi:hypothetical protein